MSVLFSDREHLRTDAEADPEAEAIFDAIRDLPPASQDEVQRQLAHVLVNYDRTRQVDPVLHFVESLLMTARLHRNPRFLKALAVADEHRVPEGPGMGRPELEQKFAELMERRASR